MKTILAILKQAGGWHHGLSLKIENPPYMAFVIEATDESGLCGLPALSVCHYSEQNGDLMRDPEMCFELGYAGGAHLNACYYRKGCHADSGEKPHCEGRCVVRTHGRHLLPGRKVKQYRHGTECFEAFPTGRIVQF